MPKLPINYLHVGLQQCLLFCCLGCRVGCSLASLLQVTLQLGHSGALLSQGVVELSLCGVEGALQGADLCGERVTLALEIGDSALQG